jgi:hypothetical protein
MFVPAMPEQSRKPTSSTLMAGPPWVAALDDLARLRALARKSEVVIHSEIRGSSMRPAIPDGARIRIRSGSEESWRLGQVIAFLAGTRIMAHRIVYEGRGAGARSFVITQGDGNWLCDPPVNRSTVVGQVEAYSTGADWQPIGGQWLPLHRRLTARFSLALARAGLEFSPMLTIRASQVFSWIRMGPHLLMSGLRRLVVGHVRP